MSPTGTAPNTNNPPVRDITTLSDKRRAILEFIGERLATQGYPPSVREIAVAVGLSSPSTVHSHLAVLEEQGFLRRDPAKPRAMEIRYEPSSGAALGPSPSKQVPLVGDVAAGTDVLAVQNIEEVLSIPASLTGSGQLFALRVRGESMVEACILDGDTIVVRSQPEANQGEIVVAGIPGGEATVKYYSRSGAVVTLTPANAAMEPLVFPASEVTIYGRVVTVLRRI